MKMQCRTINRNGVLCQNEGEPEDGFDFFMCEDCREYLMELLNQRVKRAYARHDNN